MTRLTTAQKRAAALAQHCTHPGCGAEPGVTCAGDPLDGVHQERRAAAWTPEWDAPKETTP